jgi:hypothetical protein
MIELEHNSLRFSFPEVHRYAEFSIDFRRTLRIPDDGKFYELPPGFKSFPLFHVDDFSKKVPPSWIEHGGVMLPMYQSEALWINISSHSNEEITPEEQRSFSNDWAWEFSRYPFAIKVAVGKINALTGEPWIEPLQNEPQDYMVSTEQPWLDGYCVENGIVRQFVAMPLGSGYTAEEQLAGEAEHGGLQIIVYPMKREAYERLFPPTKNTFSIEDNCPYGETCFSVGSSEMGLAPGGKMKQEIYEDPFEIDDWDMEHRSRCYVHIANSLMWRSITGKEPPTVPITARDYEEEGLPWFEYYNEKAKPLSGSKTLAGLKSVVQMGIEKGDIPLPENETVSPTNIVKLRQGLRRNQIREGLF